MIRLCPCSSGKSYELCCKPFHEGKEPSCALDLMRARFCAYALCLPEYIMATTHPKNPHYQEDFVLWKKELFRFCKDYVFQGLDIVKTQDLGNEAKVSFVAHVFKYHRSKGKQDCSFSEDSLFEKVNGKWLYLDG